MNPEENGITAVHPEYRKYHPLWKRCRDVLEGSDAVKAARELYLPRLPGQGLEGYEHYLARSIFFNITGKTLELYVSMIYSKAVTIHGPEESSPLITDCDLQGTSLSEFMEDVTTDVIGVGRCGVLVDYSGLIQSGMSIADAEREEARPYLVRYPPESITNWHSGRHGGRTILDRVVLKEKTGEESDEELQYRELVITEGSYNVRIWRKLNLVKKETWVITKDLTPLRNGEPIAELPFFFVDPECGSPRCRKPPLLDLVDINLSHYRTMADLEHGRFHSGLPTPIFAGFNFQEDEAVKLGSTEGISSNLPEAKAYYLEFSGKGLEALEKAAEQKEAWMVQLGAGLLDSSQSNREAAETLAIRRSGANATVGRMAMSVSESMTKALAFLCSWAGLGSKDVRVQLTTEYLPYLLDPQEISVLHEAVKSGDYRRVDWLSRLKAAGILGQDLAPERIDRELKEKSKSEEKPKVGFTAEPANAGTGTAQAA
jgi:hypothetical protein